VSPVRSQLSSALDTLHDDAAYVVCSVDVYKVPVDLGQKPMTPRYTNLAAVQIGNGLDFVALRAEISRSAASSCAYADR
jgi:hypothetical protein